MNDGLAGQQALSIEDPERAVWDHNLMVIAQGVSNRNSESLAKANRLVRALDREVELLSAQRDLRVTAGAGAANAGAAASQVAWLDHVIAQKRQRRKQLAALRRVSSGGGSEARSEMTPEAACKPARRDPIQVLGDLEKINADQVRAAIEIRMIYEAVGRSLGAKTLALNGVRDRNSWRSADIPASLSGARRRRFMPWAEQLRQTDPATLDVVLKIAVFGLSLYAVSRRHRISWGRCLEMLADGLDLYWKPSSGMPAIDDTRGIPRQGCP